MGSERDPLPSGLHPQGAGWTTPCLHGSSLRLDPAYFLLTSLEYRLNNKGRIRSWLPTIRPLMGSLCRVTVMGRDPYTYFDYLIRMTSKPEPEH